MKNHGLAPAFDAAPQALVDQVTGSEDFGSLPADPPLGSEVRIDASHLRLLGLATTSLVLAYAKPPHSLFLMPDKEGVPALVTKDLYRRLAAEGRAETLSNPGPADARPDAIEKLTATCGLLNAANVANGTKAISIWLNRNWSTDLIKRFGEPDNPHTIRRWRTRSRSQPPD